MTEIEHPVPPDTRVWLGGHNAVAKRAVRTVLAGTVRPTTGAIDLAVIAPLSADEAVYFVRKLTPRLTPTAAIWVVAPVSASGQSTFGDSCIAAIRAWMDQVGFKATSQRRLATEVTLLSFERRGDD